MSIKETVPSSFILETMRTSGIDYYSGVACSVLRPLFSRIDSDTTLRFHYAPRENLALGLASGAWIGGATPALLLQNSGLGHIVNAMASFVLPSKIPIFMLIGWRGYQNKCGASHAIMGRHTQNLLDTLDIPHRVLCAHDDMTSAIEEFLRSPSRPYAILIPPGQISP
jgi:sulfopyruvate decarboxylase subunit alpha